VIQTALDARDTLGRLLAAGVVAHLALHVTVNIAMVLGLAASHESELLTAPSYARLPVPALLVVSGVRRPVPSPGHAPAGEGEGRPGD
jgi:hypothetical protein